MIKCEKVVVAVALIVEKLSTTKTCFMHHWHSDIERTSNTNLYKYFKTSFGISNYINSLDKSSCKRVIAFRTSNHTLPIKTCMSLSKRDHNTFINIITYDQTCK